MSKPMRTFWILCLACAAVHAQTSNASPTFEAASVKQSPPFEPGQGVWERRDGGPGTKDPGRIDWRNVPLGAIVIIAYDIKILQLSGPDWLKNTRFDVSATIAKDATKEQFHQMLQNLLAERFQLKLHHEQRESVVYSLVVGKGGPKMKESPEVPPPAEGAAPAAPPAPGSPKKDDDGFPILNYVHGTYMVGNNRSLRIRATQETMPHFVELLINSLNRSVTDATGLKGKYDFILTFAFPGMPARSAASPDGLPEADADPDLIDAMQQIGLKLEQKKGMIDTLVIDHIEKTPTGN
jgi:uncharacterized protein (TIGR03435 family)